MKNSLFKNKTVSLSLAGIILILAIVLSNTSSELELVFNEDSPSIGLVSKKIQLDDETIERGITYVHSQTSETISGLDQALGSGACAFDMDNDNDMDIYIVGGSGAQRFYGKKAWWSRKHTGHLYRNRGDGYFENVTEQYGLSFELWGMGCNVADFDHNGFIDLLVTGRRQNVLYRNTGNGQFTKVAFDNNSAWSTSAAVGDYNNDGLMDIYIGNYLKYDKAAKHFESLSGYDTGLTQFRPDFYQAQTNKLYTNHNNFRFESDADKLNIANPEGRTLSAKWFDANNDSWPDLIVFNDAGSSTRLFINHKGRNFSKASINKHFDLPSGIRNGAINDYDNDDDGDFILSTSLGNPVALLNKKENKYQNTLWQDHDNSEIFSGFSGYGIQFIDLNNDGNDDIYHGNGLSRPDTDAKAISIGQPDVISLADGRGKFTVAAQADKSPLQVPMSTRSVIKLDIDNDGDKDILLTANNNPARLLVNNTPITQWVGFSLVDQYGNHGNYQKATIQTSKRVKTFFADNDTFLGHHDHRLTLALADNEVIHSVKIQWQNGDTRIIKPLSLNTYHVIQQNKGVTLEYKQPPTLSIRKIPIQLAIWQIKTAKFNVNEILSAYNRANRNERLEVITAIKQYDKHYRLLSVLKQALNSQDSTIVIAAVNVLKAFELEQSHYWLSVLFKHKDPQVLCATANTFRHFYIEEEAFIIHKLLAVPHLIRLLTHSKPKVVECAIMALAESKSVRAVEPIKQKLLDSKNNHIISAAIYALGELRHTRSIAALKRYSEKNALTEKALFQLNAIQKSNYQSRYSGSIIKSKQVLTACPKLPAAQLLNRQPLMIANTLEKCSTRQQQSWLSKNASIIFKKHKRFISNPYLSMESFYSAITMLANNHESDATKILLIHLQLQSNLDKKIMIIESLRQKLPHPAVTKLLKQILTNTTLQKKIRIAAGNVLIETHPELVMQYSNELFNEPAENITR